MGIQSQIKLSLQIIFKEFSLNNYEIVRSNTLIVYFLIYPIL